MTTDKDRYDLPVEAFRLRSENEALRQALQASTGVADRSKPMTPTDEEMKAVYLRDEGGEASDGQWDECWCVCSKGDPGAVTFVPIDRLQKAEARAEDLQVALENTDRTGARVLAQATALRAERDGLRGLLEQVKQACLYSEDDGAIGVTSEPHIEPELFDQIAAALKPSGSTDE